VLLEEEDLKAITPSSWLSSDHINAFHTMLHRQFPHIKGGYSVEIGSKGHQFPPVEGEPWIQIVHDADAKHWLVLACGFFSDVKTVFIFDSLTFNPKSREHTLMCMSSLVRTESESISYSVLPCQKQTNGYDCGVFAIAFATSLAFGEDPRELVYSSDTLRPFLIDCFRKNVLSTFPSIRNSKPIGFGRFRSFSIDIYCSCRRTDYNSTSSEWQMVVCDKCNECFHRMCVDNYPKKEGSWMCSHCENSK
jgi:hypothetical protein